MKNLILSYLIIIILITLFSCDHQKKSITNNTIVDTLLSKTISFPKSLSLLKGNRIQKADSLFQEIKGKTKLVSIIDANCPKCIINQLNKIDSIFNSILLDKDNVIIFILNVSKNDSAFFMLNLQPSIKAEGILLWDDNYNFEKKNNLFTTDMNLRTFMVNNENKIVQYGNPLLNPNVIIKYQKKLEN